MAIAKTEEFIREAEGLAIDFPDALQNEVYSSSTTYFLRKILPRDYSEKVNDAITSVDFSDKEKLKAIKTLLEAKKMSAILGVDVHEAEQSSKSRTNSSNYSSTNNRQHDCGKERCRVGWDLLGCVELYKLATVEQRKKMILSTRNCLKCGAPFRKVDGKFHRCSWENTKDVA